MSCELGPSSVSSQRMDHPLTQSLDSYFCSDFHALEVASDECLSKVQSLLSCPSKISAARNFQGSQAETFIEFLDRVSKPYAPCYRQLDGQMQALSELPLDRKLRQRGLRLLSKICKTQRIIPTSYILQKEFIRVGSIQDRGGFSEVSDGEYLGCTVAIKDLKTRKDDFDRIFKVCSTNDPRSRR